MRKNQILAYTVIGLFALSIGIAPASGETLVNPADDRALIKTAEVLAKYSYNGSDISGSGMFNMDSSGFRLLATERENETIANFGKTKGASSEARFSDLNITGGIGFSSSVYNDISATPRGFEGASRISAARDIGQMEDKQLVSWAQEDQMQYYGYESIELDTIEDEIAKSYDRTWGVADIDFSALYVSMTLDLALVQAMINAIISAADYQDAEAVPMTETEYAAVMDDVLGAYTRGVMLGVHNSTQLQEGSGKTGWTGITEIADTFNDLNNDTDNTLASFQSGTSFITLALVSYLMEIGVETLDTSMLSPGDYRIVDDVGVGKWVGARLVYEGDAVQLDVVLDVTTDVLIAGLANATTDWVLSLFSAVGYEVPPEVTPWLGIILLVIVIHLAFALVIGTVIKAGNAKKSNKQNFFAAYYSWQFDMVGPAAPFKFLVAIVSVAFPIWIVIAFLM